MLQKKKIQKSHRKKKSINGEIFLLRHKKKWKEEQWEDRKKNGK